MAETEKPLASADNTDLEQFRIHSGLEIVRILRDLVRNTQLVTVYFNEGRDFILTTVLEVDGDKNYVVLDYGPGEALNQRLLAANRAVLVTRHNQVRVQFSVDQVLKAIYQKEPAFVVPVPNSLIRVQRREFYRLSTPLGQRLNLSMVGADGNLIHAHIVDISIGGVGIIEPPEGQQCGWEEGTLVPTCRIELPEEGVIEADIEIRNRYQTGNKNGEPVYRIGCRLLNLDSRRSASIQRYIQKIELERRRLRED